MASNFHCKNFNISTGIMQKLKLSINACHFKRNTAVIYNHNNYVFPGSEFHRYMAEGKKE